MREVKPTTNNRVVVVSGDGRCFFRCLATFFLSSLQNVARDFTGKITQLGAAIDEKRFSDELRAAVCELLSAHSDVLSHAAHRLPFLLDTCTDVGQLRYASIPSRIANMTKPSTFVGNLEIVAAAYLLRRQIFIYTQSSNDTPTLVAKLPTNLLASNSPVHLLYDSDTKHFNLIIVPSLVQDLALTNYRPGCCVNEILRDIETTCSPIEKFTKFADLLNDHSGEGYTNGKNLGSSASSTTLDTHSNGDEETLHKDSNAHLWDLVDCRSKESEKNEGLTIACDVELAMVDACAGGDSLTAKANMVANQPKNRQFPAKAFAHS